jgi:hypothetical protein
MARTDMTVRDLINNPTGFNTRQVAARYTIRDALRAKFLAAVNDPSRKKRFKVYISGKDRNFIVWIKVPSEQYAIDYDVILQLSFPEGVRAVANADVKLYCNSPSWTFVYGYAYRHAGLLATGWDKQLGRAASEKPEVTNIALDTGFDKVVFQGILFLTGPAGYVTINDLSQNIDKIIPNPSDPKLSAQAKLFEYKKAKAKYDLSVKIVKKAEKETKRIDNQTKKSTVRNAAGKAKMVKAVNSVKKSRSK